MDPSLATMTSATLRMAGITGVLDALLTLYPNLSIFRTTVSALASQQTNSNHSRKDWQRARRRGTRPAFTRTDANTGAASQMSIDRAKKEVETHEIRQLQEGALCPVDAEHRLEVGIEDIEEL